MILPIGDAPDPRGGVPVVTSLLIAANVAVYVLITFPLESVRPEVGPALREYVRVMSQALGDRAAVAELLRQVSAYDLFVFVHGFRPADPSLAALFTSMFPSALCTMP